ncbi:MAG: PhoH family protein [Verrucomicrobiales bacterium]|nr:PhoH family protein [Verrucomicrobiales bacterium]
MAMETLTFETPQFLHSLLGEDLKQLREIGERCHATLTSRDAWVRIEGDEAALARVRSVFQALESVRRQGGDVSPALVRLIAEEAAAGDAPEAGEEVVRLRLLTGGRKRPVLAKTRGQIAYLQAMRDHEVVFGIGPAGTGKTYLAMAQGLHLLKERVVQKLVLTRPAVEAGEALGFLPGDLKEKVFPYLRPLYDALYEMLDPDEAERLIERGSIEIAPLAYMRGRTLKHAFIILDEAQNTTTEQMLMFLTRLGDGARCAVTGDPSQVDLRRGVRSGLWEATQVLKAVEGVAFIEFVAKDVVRLPVVQRIIDAYAAHRQIEEEERRARKAERRPSRPLAIPQDEDWEPGTGSAAARDSSAASASEEAVG